MKSRLHILLGKDRGKTFDLENGKIYTVGRLPGNDIQIDDKSVSRFHLKIQFKDNKYFITDFNSKNGTFVAGKDIASGIEVELDEKNPIVIGMNVIGLGKTCGSWLKNFLEAVDIGSENDKDVKISKSYGVVEIKKQMAFIYDVNNILGESKNINEISEKMLECIVNLFKKVDRCAVILINSETKEIENVIYRSKKPLADPSKAYNIELVEQALSLNKAVMVSDSYDEYDEYDIITKSLQLKNIRFAMCAPMNSPLQTRGAIYVDSIGGLYGFLKNDMALLENIGGRVALALDHLSQESRL